MNTDWPLSAAGWEAAARTVVDPGAWAFHAGGAGDEITLRDNVAGWHRWALRPRVLVDVSAVDTSVTVLGRKLAHPVVVAPTAYQVGAHEDGEIGMARGAEAADALYCLSTSASTTPADLATAVPVENRWFQLYLRDDLAAGIRVMEDVAALGYTAVVLTVDLPVIGIRDRERANPWEPDVPMTTIARSGRPPVAVLDLPALETLAAACPVPLLVKGILDPRDARLAVEAGAAGIIVSNHGGRQLDRALATADVLEEVVGEVGSDVDVLVDGGIRRGADVVTALALGARAVLVGRPPLWGLAVGGADGAAAVLGQLVEEVSVTLALLGVPRADAVGRDQVVRAPWR